VIDARDYGVSAGATDNAGPINVALQIGAALQQEVRLPRGVLRTLSPIVARNVTGTNRGGRILSGEGSGMTIIRADFDGQHILDIDGSSYVPGRFFRGATIEGLTIDGNKAGKTGQAGIRMNGFLFGKMADVEVTNCAGDGIVSPVRTDIAANADFYESDPIFERVFITYCDGWGVNGASANGFNPVFDDFFIGANKAGGVAFSGVGLTMRNGSLAGNGYAQTEANGNHGTNLRTSGASRRTIIEQVEFDPDWGGVSTLDSHWDCLRACGAVVLPSRFNMRAGASGPIRPVNAVIVSRGTEHQASQAVRFVGPRVRIDTPGDVTLFNVANRGNVIGFTVDDMQLENGGAATVTVFAGANEAQAFANNYTVKRHDGTYDLRGRAPAAVA
jgi:hypothetical protein